MYLCVYNCVMYVAKINCNHKQQNVMEHYILSIHFIHYYIPLKQDRCYAQITLLFGGFANFASEYFSVINDIYFLLSYATTYGCHKQLCGITHIAYFKLTHH